MPCYQPITGYRSSDGRNKETGKWPIKFGLSNAYKDLQVVIPCGKCIGCALERSRQWAVRIVHEASLYEHNSFVTLTYNNENLPPGGNLRPKDLSNFWKYLRRDYGAGIRYFACGEYGEHLHRPHYHACIFNHQFDDLEIHSKKKGIILYTSERLKRLWTKGHSTIGEVNFNSAAYVARYILKKRFGDNATEHYEPHINKETGEEQTAKVREFVRMSNKPGIGHDWMKKYSSDIYPNDSLIVNKHACKPPRYYDKYMEKLNPQQMVEVRARRLANKKKQTDARLAVREEVQTKKAKLLLRSIESLDSCFAGMEP